MDSFDLDNQCYKFKKDTFECLQCEATKYPTFGHCCDEGKFYNNKTCENVISISKCLRYKESDKTCSKC